MDLPQSAQLEDGNGQITDSTCNTCYQREDGSQGLLGLNEAEVCAERCANQDQDGHHDDVLDHELVTGIGLGLLDIEDAAKVLGSAAAGVKGGSPNILLDGQLPLLGVVATVGTSAELFVGNVHACLVVNAAHGAAGVEVKLRTLAGTGTGREGPEGNKLQSQQCQHQNSGGNVAQPNPFFRNLHFFFFPFTKTVAGESNVFTLTLC